MIEKRKKSTILFIAVALISIIFASCSPPTSQSRARLVMFVGVDVSGSFLGTNYYDDAMAFLSHYIYGHLNGLGELSTLRALFVGSIGGKSKDEPKAFHPIHDLQDKDVTQIEAALREWFPPKDTMTDFSAFFEEVARHTKDRNLSLAPISLLIVTDGVPATESLEGKAAYEKINLEPLEYLSRRVTVRLTYLRPKIAKHWREDVPARRVRIWTCAGEVMEGWKNQMEAGVELAQQEKLWKWVKDNVDFRVRSRRF
ncbi:MAG: hypothetical protein GQ536_07515 [Candidatus Aminicenantes bacterium]|nr:hypothetical protein [Candidatus Aminicenantes bacterium]